MLLSIWTHSVIICIVMYIVKNILFHLDLFRFAFVSGTYFILIWIKIRIPYFDLNEDLILMKLNS